MTAEVDKPAPDFTLPATRDGEVSLSSLKGQNVVLYLYPRDNTPGCSQEGQDFRDLYEAFRQANTEVLGVSRDSLKKHENFSSKFDFPFPLLADVDSEVCNAYDVIREKQMYGKTHEGIERSTYLIDREGVVREIWRKVKVKDHAQTVLDAARAL
ncbi:MAG: peroxiredoxin [Salinisphaeraceae bacterium]|nr:peroxiredoxin [Salinisphaeraceae bacterium]